MEELGVAVEERVSVLEQAEHPEHFEVKLHRAMARIQPTPTAVRSLALHIVWRKIRSGEHEIVLTHEELMQRVLIAQMLHNGQAVQQAA